MRTQKLDVRVTLKGRATLGIATWISGVTSFFILRRGVINPFLNPSILWILWRGVFDDVEIHTQIEQWFEQYADDVYSFLSYYCGSLDVDDLVQDTFLRAMAKMDLYKGKASPKTWLCSIARNVAKDSFRKQRKSSSSLDASVLMQVPSSEMSPEGMTQLNETKQSLHAVIQRLQPNYRDVVIMRGILDLSVSETGSVLGWTDGKVRTVYHRALKSLRRHLTDTLGEEFKDGYL